MRCCGEAVVVMVILLAPVAFVSMVIYHFPRVRVGIEIVRASMCSWEDVEAQNLCLRSSSGM